MITILLELKPKPDKVDVLLAILKEKLQETRAYEGCHGVEVQQNQEKPADVVLIARWETREHFDKYNAWRDETGALAVLGDVVEGSATVRYFTDTGS